MYCEIKLRFNNLQQQPQLYSIKKKNKPKYKCGSSSLQVKLKQEKEV